MNVPFLLLYSLLFYAKYAVKIGFIIQREVRKWKENQLICSTCSNNVKLLPNDPIFFSSNFIYENLFLNIIILGTKLRIFTKKTFYFEFS